MSELQDTPHQGTSELSICFFSTFAVITPLDRFRIGLMARSATKYAQHVHNAASQVGFVLVILMNLISFSATRRRLSNAELSVRFRRPLTNPIQAQRLPLSGKLLVHFSAGRMCFHALRTSIAKLNLSDSAQKVFKLSNSTTANLGNKFDWRKSTE